MDLMIGRDDGARGSLPDRGAMRMRALLAGGGLIALAAVLAALAGPGHAAGDQKRGEAPPDRIAAGTVQPAATPDAASQRGSDSMQLVVDPSEVTADSLISRNQAAPRDPNKGPVTNLPLPRYVSLKGGEGNARRGPSLSHRIDWVFRHPGMPLRVVAEFGHWRRVEDQDGAGGWVHYSLLSGVRTVLVTKDMVELRTRPESSGATVARAEAGAILRLNECNRDWCTVSADGARGWVEKASLWGVDAEETRQ